MDLRDALQQKLGTAYAIERELGGGGMSRVFLAQEQALGRPVVVKLLPADFAAELSIERFKREIALAASLQHPHIVAVLSAGDVDGMPYFVMPYVEGKSLRQRLIQGPLPVGEVVPILRDVARALAFAHDRGVVHRDVKPDNVLLAHGSAVLTDFGVAKALSDSQLEATPAGGAVLTRVGTSLGTPDYMAPEQASGGEVDQRADLYAFGVMAYEILTGRTPFAGRSLPQLIAAHIAEAPLALAERNADVSVSLADLVMRCLEKDPAHRPQSAAEIVAALERPSVTSGPVAAAVTGRQGAGRRWAGITAAVAVVGLAALGAAMIAGRGPTPAAASDRSIAVLPFGTVGADTANLYFAAGMTEQLTGALADVPGLRVASRTAGLAQGDPAKGPQELGRELGVTTLLEGTVRRDGDRLRVSARLVSAADGLTLWSHTFERRAADVFDVQDSLSAAIVAAIRARFGGALTAHSVRRGTSDLEAYDLYLRGRFFFERRGAEGLRRAIGHFEDAVGRDSLYAEAWAGLASAYGILPLYEGVQVDSVLPLALRAADRAIELDSTLASAFAARANLLSAGWRWDEAEADLRRAIALDPGDPTAHQWLGENLLIRGRVAEAVAALERAATLDSLAPIIRASHAVALGIAGDTDSAIRLGRHAVELDPSLDAAQYLLSAVYLYAGRPAAAIALLEPMIPRLAGPAIGQGLLGYAYGVSGRMDDARALLAQLDATQPTGGNAAAIARIHLGLGDLEACLTWLDRAAEWREPFFASESMAAPLFDPLRGNPRFAALLRQVGFDPTLLAGGRRMP